MQFYLSNVTLWEAPVQVFTFYYLYHSFLFHNYEVKQTGLSVLLKDILSVVRKYQCFHFVWVHMLWPLTLKMRKIMSEMMSFSWGCTSFTFVLPSFWHSLFQKKRAHTFLVFEITSVLNFEKLIVLSIILDVHNPEKRDRSVNVQFDFVECIILV